jgi:carboxylesterase type B
MGQYTFGPAVDGIFVQQDPKQLLVQGKYDPNVRFMVGHTSNEGLGFTPTNVTSDTTYNSFVEGLLLGSDADADVLSDIESTVYPPVSNDTQYSSEFDRAALTSGDIIINCNAVELSRAYGNQTYAYLFAVAPGVHGQDFVYTYYSFNTSSNSTVGQVLQEYIVSFVTNGKPTTTVSGAPDIDFYGADSELVELDTDGITKKMDPSADHGCEWWLDLVS